MGLFDRKKPKADFSNVQSGSSSSAPQTRESTGLPERTYTVRKGDTLSAIAQREYGDAGDWRRIFEANRDRIEDPDLIFPGQELRIPDTQGGAR